MGWAMRNKHGRRGIVTSTIEHRAVLAPCDWLKEQGFELTVLRVDANGVVDMDAARKAINQDTALVSIMLANNEIGTIQPIAELAKLAHENGALIHSDGVQAAGKMQVDVQALDVDAMSLSAHKFYGPKGAGVLYLRDKIPYNCFMQGGTHENSRRAGTVAVPQIAALTTALELADKKRREKGEHLRALRDQLVREVLAKVSGAHLNGDLACCTLNTASIRFDGVYAGYLLRKMDQAGILASAGSACMWERTKPSHVLMALGLTEEEGSGTIRFSLGYANTAAEVTQVADALGKMVPAMRLEPQPA
jgi:cysteine desulfurase